MSVYYPRAGSKDPVLKAKIFLKNRVWHRIGLKRGKRLLILISQKQSLVMIYRACFQTHKSLTYSIAQRVLEIIRFVFPEILKKSIF